jgi:hypothetical protein
VPWSYYTPGSDEHGPRFLTGGPGAAPGDVASKNGWVYMRVQGGFHFLWLVCVSICGRQNGGWSFKNSATVCRGESRK